MINDLSITLVNCKAENNKFSIDFIAGTQEDAQVMCYLLSLILAGKNTQFGPLDAKSLMQEFQEDYYKLKNLHPSIDQWKMVFSIEVDYASKTQRHFCKFRDQVSENMNVELLCIQSDHVGMRIDFHAAETLADIASVASETDETKQRQAIEISRQEQLKNGCFFIYMVLRGKGANQGHAYVNTIYEQFLETFMKQKQQNVLTSIKDVSFLYGVMYENSDQRFICYT